MRARADSLLGPTPTISQSMATTGVSDAVPEPSGFSNASRFTRVLSETDFSGFSSRKRLIIIELHKNYLRFASAGFRKINFFILSQFDPIFAFLGWVSFVAVFSFVSFFTINTNLSSLVFPHFLKLNIGVVGATIILGQSVFHLGQLYFFLSICLYFCIG